MTPTPPPQTPDIVALVCASGPDQGKRIALSAQDVILGRSPQAGLLSGDPDANEQHVAVAGRDGAVRFRTLGEAKVFVDASEHTEGTLAPGQQLRVGRSFWQLATITVTPGERSTPCSRR